MFTLKDFPIGSNLYWIRKVSDKTTQVVYTCYQITGHDEEENLLSEITSKKQMIDAPNVLVSRHRTHNVFTVIHAKKFYKNYNPSNMIIPEVLFNIFHHPEKLPQNSLNELHKLFGSGLRDLDDLIKSATTTFEEWNKDKNHKTVTKIKCDDLFKEK